MKQLKSYFFTYCIFTIACLLFIQYGCKKDDNNEQEKIIKEKLSGYIQKGPFINGTSIGIYELNSDLSQTGNVFNTQISNNHGYFEISNIEFSSQYVEFKADGYYFDEVRGKNSRSLFTLYALSDVTDISTINVNVLTHLEKGRIEYLIEHGLDFSQAKDSAQSEILKIFNIEKGDVAASESLDISVDNEDNAILLAISVILQGRRSVADLSELMANIKFDISEDGVIDNQSILANLLNSTQLLDIPSIRENLVNRYDNLGISASIPNFENYISTFLANETHFEIEVNIGNNSCYGYDDGYIDITIIEGNPPYNFEWSNGITSEDINNLVAGNYELTITDNYGYNAIREYTITEPEGMIFEVVIVDESELGNDGSIDLSVTGGIEPYTFEWSNGATSEDIFNLTSEYYSVTVTDAIDCSINQTYSINSDVLVDSRDGQVYNIVIIGNQIWMAENLNYNAGSGSWVYNDNSSNADTYGRLYDWEIACEVCPNGWHLPSDAEWSELSDYLGGLEIAGGKMKEIGTREGGNGLWSSPNTDATNESGFAALPGGIRISDDGSSGDMGLIAYFWSATEEYGTATARSRTLRYDYSGVGRYNEVVIYSQSVRCIKD